MAHAQGAWHGHHHLDQSERRRLAERAKLVIGTVPAETDTADMNQPGSYTITAAVFIGRVGSVLLDDPNAVLQVQGLTLVNALTLQAGILDFGEGGLTGTVIAAGGSLEVGQLANFTNLVWVGDFDLNHGFVIASGLTVEAAGGGAGRSPSTTPPCNSPAR